MNPADLDVANEMTKTFERLAAGAREARVQRRDEQLPDFLVEGHRAQRLPDPRRGIAIDLRLNLRRPAEAGRQRLMMRHGYSRNQRERCDGNTRHAGW